MFPLRLFLLGFLLAPLASVSFFLAGVRDALTSLITSIDPIFSAQLSRNFDNTFPLEGDQLKGQEKEKGEIMVNKKYHTKLYTEILICAVTFTETCIMCTHHSTL